MKRPLLFTLVVSLTVAGCYGPNYNAACFSCTQSSECPTGSSCTAAGVCTGGSCAPAASACPPGQRRSGSGCGPGLPGMVEIPGGTFPMGATVATDPAARPDEAPVRSMTVGDFFLDRTEVTVAAYRQCKVCSAPGTGPSCTFTAEGGSRDAAPVNCISAAQAAAFCQAQGKRLPTEAEWEYAARGSSGSLYPWGNAAPGERSACWGKSAPCAVGGYPDTLLGAGVASGQGLVDLAGNLWEWTSTSYCGYDGQGCTGALVLRGGAYNRTDAAALRGSQRNATVGQPSDAGFRCARDL